MSADRKTCGTCMRPLPESTPYRKPGEVQSEPEAAKSPKAEAPRLVLEEEFREANLEYGNWFAAALGCWSVALLVAAWAVSTDLAAADVIGAGCVVAAIFFTFGCLRCRTTVRAWRDQKRAKVGGPK